MRPDIMVWELVVNASSSFPMKVTPTLISSCNTVMSMAAKSGNP